MALREHIRRLVRLHAHDAEFVAFTLGVPALLGAISVGWWLGSWLVFGLAIPALYVGLLSLLTFRQTAWIPMLVGSVVFGAPIGLLGGAVASKHLGSAAGWAAGAVVFLLTGALGVWSFRELAKRASGGTEPSGEKAIQGRPNT